MKVNIAGRVAQHSIFIVGSSLLFLNNYLNGSVMGCAASTFFVLGNVYGIYLYVRSKKKS